MKREGFRPTAEQLAEQEQARKAKQTNDKHVTHGELAVLEADVKRLANQLVKFGALTTSYTVRVEALAKTVFDGGLAPLETFDVNFQRLMEIQRFLSQLAQQNLSMTERVQAAIQFNDGRDPSFKVTDAYLPIRAWLVSNAEGFSGEQLVDMATGMGFSQTETEKILVEMTVNRELLEESKGGAVTPIRVG